MAQQLNMSGSYELTEQKIDEVVTKTSAGNYALGYIKEESFIVKYVGKSDTDVNERLKDWVKKYKRFKYSYASSPKEAFEKECRNFHDFGGIPSLDNKKHPDRPANTDWKCPACDVFD